MKLVVDKGWIFLSTWSTDQSVWKCWGRPIPCSVSKMQSRMHTRLGYATSKITNIFKLSLKMVARKWQSCLEMLLCTTSSLPRTEVIEERKHYAEAGRRQRIMFHAMIRVTEGIHLCWRTKKRKVERLRIFRSQILAFRNHPYLDLLP